MKTNLFKIPVVVFLFVSFVIYGQKQDITDNNLDNIPVYFVTNGTTYEDQSELNKNILDYSSDCAASIFMPLVSETGQSNSEETKMQQSKKYYGYSFEDYPAYYSKESKKAPLNIIKSKVKVHDKKTVISDYNKNSVNFGGHYQLYDMEKVITANDGFGSSIETNTIIIDTKTGIAYPTPFFGLGDANCETGYSKKLFENTVFLYKKNSNLMITHECEFDFELDDKFIIEIYKWDGTKFQLLETKKGRRNNKK